MSRAQDKIPDWKTAKQNSFKGEGPVFFCFLNTHSIQHIGFSQFIAHRHTIFFWITLAKLTVLEIAALFFIYFFLLKSQFMCKTFSRVCVCGGVPFETENTAKIFITYLVYVVCDMSRISFSYKYSETLSHKHLSSQTNLYIYRERERYTIYIIIDD